MVRDRTRAPGGFPAFRPTCGRAVQNAGRKDPSYLDIHTGHTGVARGDATALVARYGQPQRHRDEVYGFAPPGPGAAPAMPSPSCATTEHRCECEVQAR